MLETINELLATLANPPGLDRATEPEMLARYALQIVLLCGSAFFSGSETALFSLSRIDLAQLRRERNRRAEVLHQLLDEPRRLIVSILCGNELVNIAAVANMTAILVVLYGDSQAGWINIAVMLPLLLLVGEVTPKTIAVSNPRAISASIVAAPMSVWVRVVAPMRWIIRAAADRITTWIVGPQRAAEHILQVDELRSLVEDVAEAGRLDATGRVLINNLLSAGATEIVEIMTPRSRIRFLDANQDLPRMIDEFRKARHSRVPVYREHRDNLVGFLYVEDILRLDRNASDLDSATIEEVVRPPIVVPLTKTAGEMFAFFRANPARTAVVLNEFGGVAGLITENDVLRFIFGDLVGPTSDEDLLLRPSPNVYELPGDMKLTEFNRLTKLALTDARMTTVGGVVFRHIDRLPQVGDEVSIDGLRITVLEMDAHRVAPGRHRGRRGSRSRRSRDDTVG